MSDLIYQRTVIAYHGCDDSVAKGVLSRGKPLAPSRNEYDWLGRGIYFWEHGPQRALEWAQSQAVARRGVHKPAVLGAIIHLGNCFDLLDTAYTQLLGRLFPLFCEACNTEQIPIPENLPASGEAAGDLIRRHLDCAVLNWSIDAWEKTERLHFHTVRAVFTEGAPAFPGAKIMSKSHIQIAVRDSAAIVGYFKPQIDKVIN